MFYSVTTAPVSPPEDLNVTALTSMSFILTWSSPPLPSQNGVIRGYRINVTELETGRVQLLNSTDVSLSVTLLHPYYTYICQVSAFTVAYGPYSDGFRIITPQDGENNDCKICSSLFMLYCFLFSTKWLSSGSVCAKYIFSKRGASLESPSTRREKWHHHKLCYHLWCTQ